jgi:integrase/recombinase XerC
MPLQRATTLSLASIERFHSWLSGTGRSSNTARAYASDLRVLRNSLSYDPSLEDLEELTMIWLNADRQRLSPKTTVRRLTSVKSFSRWAGHGEILGEYVAPTPARALPHPIPEGMDGVLRMVQAARLPHHRALVALGGLVGCRVAESLGVRTGDLDTRDRLLTIRGKGDKTRVVPVSARAWDIILPAWLDAQVTRSNVVPIGDRSARETITSLGKRARLTRHVTSHDLRATYGTWVYDRTCDLRVVQELLGHSSPETTQVYTQIGMGKMRAAVEL